MDSLITAPMQDANRIEEKFFNTPLNFNLDITRVTNQFDELTYDEKMLIAIYPLQAFQIKMNIQEAFSAADATGLPNPLNGKQDAFRHAFFQAINTRDVSPRLIGPNALSGSVIVSLFAFAHESVVPDQLHLEKEKIYSSYRLSKFPTKQLLHLLLPAPAHRALCRLL